MTAVSEPAEYFDDRVAKRNAIILALAMTLSSASAIIVFITAGIAGQMLSPTPSLITLPVSSFVIGTALATIPASLLMGKVGRQPGFMIGAALAFFGALLAVYALFERSFVLFCLGTMLLGMYMAFSQFYRFAAADRATEAFRAKAIAWVMFGGIGGSVIARYLVANTQDLFSPVLFAGSFVASAVLALIALVLLSFLDIPKLPNTQDNRPTRPLKEILAQPRLRVAMIVGMVSYGVMNLLMTATPLAMVGCGLTVNDSGWVIQWHAIAMFGPSFFTGSLIARFGVEKVMFAGLAMLVAAAVTSLSGLSFEHFTIGLILLGLGWNFGFIGATTMVTECYEPAEKAKVQGFNDFAVFATVALSSLTSGKLFSSIGWNAVNMALFPMVGIALVALVWLFFQSRKSPQIPKSL